MDWNFRRRFFGIVVTFSVLAAGLLLYNIYIRTIEGGIRDFIAEQGIWSKSQKTAVIKLMSYVQHGDDARFADYQEEMRKLRMDNQAIDSLKNNSLAKIDSLFLPLLADLKKDNYQNFETFVSVYSSPILSSILPSAPLFVQAFATREEAETQLLRLRKLAHTIKAEYRDGLPAYQKRVQYIKQLESIDRKLTTLAYDFTYHLSDLSKSLHQFALFTLTVLGAVLLFIGGFTSFYYVKKRNEWKSKLMQKNKNLKSSKKTYQDLLKSIKDGIIIQNENGKFVEVNPSAAKMFGYAESEMVGLTAEDIIAPASFGKARETSFLEEAFSGQRIIFERWAQRKDRTTFPMEVSLSNGKFFDDDVIIGVVRDITDRREAIKDLQQANQQNKVLLQEVHHRVKNNMALIASLLQLQAFDIADPEIQSILSRSQSRIHTIADVHEHQYQSKNLVSIDFQSYLNTLVERFNAPVVSDANINITSNTPSFSLNVNQALPAALLLNEILMHITGYQPTEKDDKEININIDIETEQDLVKIDIQGKNYRKGNDDQTESKLGLEIIQTLTKQLDAEFEISSDGALHFSIAFKQIRDLKGSVSSINLS